MPSPAAIAERWVRPTDQRYYELHLSQDLFGTWCLLRVWGRQRSALGGQRQMIFSRRQQAMVTLEAIRRRRQCRGYQAAGPLHY